MSFACFDGHFFSLPFPPPRMSVMLVRCNRGVCRLAGQTVCQQLARRSLELLPTTLHLPLGNLKLRILFAVRHSKVVQTLHIPDICHLHHLYVGGEKICHVEKFQNSIKNLNNLWSFYRNLCLFLFKSVWRKI